jgi:glycerol-3-phosphate O-acyltransferase
MNIRLHSVTEPPVKMSGGRGINLVSCARSHVDLLILSCFLIERELGLHLVPN